MTITTLEQKLGKYAWLAKEPGPRMLVEALKLYGTEEKPGGENNPVILEWAKETNLPAYNADSIPWCGLFMAVVAKRANKTIPKDPLWALHWKNFGDQADIQLGAVLVFTRDGGKGHVGIYVGEDKLRYHVLGGNQGDAVSITRILKTRLVACRAQYTINPPLNVRRVLLDSTGDVSTNEA